LEILRINEELKALDDDQNHIELKYPEMEKSAFPELRYVVTPEDILLLQREEAEQLNSAKKDGDGGLGGFGGGNAAPAPAPVAAPVPVVPATDEKQLTLKKNEASELSMIVKNTVFENSQLEKMELETRRKVLQYKRSRILKVGHKKLSSNFIF
jgi:hypothetical protein